MFLVKAGFRRATLAARIPPGAPQPPPPNTLTAPSTTLEAVKKLFAENPGEIAG